MAIVEEKGVIEKKGKGEHDWENVTEVRYASDAYDW